MRKLNLIAAIATACILSAPALAAPYVSLYGGASLLEEADNTGDPFVAGAPDTSLESEFDTGFVVGGTVGVAISAVFDARIELDLNYRNHSVDELTIESDGGLGGLLGVGSLNGLSTSDVDGDVHAFGALVNYWLDIKNRTAFTPYFGGGLGLAYIDINDLEVAGTTVVDDSDVVFAWQLGAGVGWNFTPNWTLSLDYRWFATADPDLEDEGDGDFESEYSSHNIMAGIAYTF